MHARLALGICVHSQVLPHNTLHYTMQPRCVSVRLCVSEIFPLGSPAGSALWLCWRQTKGTSPSLFPSAGYVKFTGAKRFLPKKKIILQCRESVIIATRALIALRRPATGAGSGLGPSWESFQGEIYRSNPGGATVDYCIKFSL